MYGENTTVYCISNKVDNATTSLNDTLSKLITGGWRTLKHFTRQSAKQRYFKENRTSDHLIL